VIGRAVIYTGGDRRGGHHESNILRPLQSICPGRPLHEIAQAATRIVESRRIRQVLKQTGGNKTRAAEILQVSYKTLLTKIKDYQLE
jgi:DNA-binding NtrC family response regulator